MLAICTVAFDWSSVGAGPAADQIEVTVIGPGFGEAILVHVGQGQWLCVDSCVDTTIPRDGNPVSLRYLRALGVDPEIAVRLIVATHWHDDHARGMAELVRACPQAAFGCGSALTDKEFLELIEEYGTQEDATDGAKVREHRQVIRLLKERRHSIRAALGARRLISLSTPSIAPGQCDVDALSPSDAEFTLFMQRIASQRPTAGNSGIAATPGEPNLCSVVVSIGWGSRSVLLGADMEGHVLETRGWNAAAGEASTLHLNPADLVKIPHHGATSGHSERMWSVMLKQDPVSILTPFNRAPMARKLPTDGDIIRVRGLSTNAYITSRRSGIKQAARDPAVERNLRDSGIDVTSLRHPLGLVRARRTTTSDWDIQLFGAACRLEQHAA